MPLPITVRPSVCVGLACGVVADKSVDVVVGRAEIEGRRGIGGGGAGVRAVFKHGQLRGVRVGDAGEGLIVPH